MLNASQEEIRMSSVGSSDSSNRQDEVVRRNREDYRKNESELIKKQKQELRRISEQHYQEIEKLKEAHQQQLDDVKKQSRDTISERDHRYQKSIDGLREMHVKQLKETAEENSRKEEALRRATTTDFDSERDRNDARFEKLSEDYRNNLVKYEEAHKQSSEANREAQAQAIKENREQLGRAYQKQNDALREERNQKVRNLENQFSSYRESADSRLRDQQVNHMKSKQQDSSNMMRAVNRERQASQDNEQILREGFNDGLNTMKERYNKAMEKERKALSASSQDFQSTVDNRIDNDVRRLANENQDLRESNNRQTLLMKNEHKRELNNVKDAFGKNVQNALDQRDEAIRSTNERVAEDVGKVRDDMGKQLVDTTRFYQGRMGEQNRIQRTAYDNLVGDFDSRQEATKSTADQRVKMVHDRAEEDKQRLIQQQAEMHVASQDQMKEQVRLAREQSDAEKQVAVRTVQDQMRKQEIQHTNKMNQIVSKYEKQIQTLKDQVVRERKIGEENVKKAVDELQRAHKVSIDQLEAKNRDQIRQMNSTQAEELRSLNRRHEEKLDQVLTEVKKT